MSEPVDAGGGASSLPEVHMSGEGTVTPPGKKDPALRFERHYQEFLSRGISEPEAKRLAEAVLARDAVPPPALELSAEEQARLDARD